MTDRELMQQALEALVWECGSEPSLYAPKTAATITALRERLAQPEQEPVAGEPLPCPFCGNSGLDFDEGSTHRWGIASCSGCGASCGEIRREYPDKGEWHKEAIAEWNRRASPPAQRKPLTDEVIWLEYQRFWPFHPAEEPTLAKDIVKFARAIEAKLKEKNT